MSLRHVCSLALVGSTIAGGLAAQDSSASAGATRVNVRLSEWKLELSRLTVPTGDIAFTVTNGGSMAHEFEVEGQGLEKALPSIRVGATSTLRLNLPPGSYEVYCPVGNDAHKAMGMVAHIEVTGAVDMSKLTADLRQGGYVIVFRHGATNRDQADTDPLHLSNVAAQRVLSTAGRDVASRVGDAFKRLGVPLGTVYSSQFNRAVETATLLSGRDSVTTTPDVSEGGLVVPTTENERRAKALRALALQSPSAGTNTLVVTHKPNILDAFGEDWFGSKEGEASIFRPDGTDDLVLVARVQPADWIKAAAVPSTRASRR